MTDDYRPIQMTKSAVGIPTSDRLLPVQCESWSLIPAIAVDRFAGEIHIMHGDMFMVLLTINGWLLAAISQIDEQQVEESCIISKVISPS